MVWRSCSREQGHYCRTVSVSATGGRKVAEIPALCWGKPGISHATQQPGSNAVCDDPLRYFHRRFTIDSIALSCSCAVRLPATWIRSLRRPKNASQFKKSRSAWWVNSTRITRKLLLWCCCCCCCCCWHWHTVTMPECLPKERMLYQHDDLLQSSTKDVQRYFLAAKYVLTTFLLLLLLLMLLLLLIWLLFSHPM